MDAALVALTLTLLAQPVKVAFVGDSGAGGNFQDVLNLIAAEGADAVVHAGDFSYNGVSGWTSMIEDTLGPTYPYFGACGNHDDGDFHGGFQTWLEEQATENGIAWTGSLGEASWHSWNGLFIVATTPDVFQSESEAGQTVADAMATPEAQASSWRISFHHMVQERTQIGGKSDQAGWAVYHNAFAAGAIVATAHEHSYARSHLLDDPETQSVVDDDFDYVLEPGRSFFFHSGLGGRSIRDQERCFPSTPPYGCGGEWASVYTTDQGADYGALFITFRDGDPCRASGYFKDINGNVIDEFAFSSGVGPCAGKVPCVPDCPFEFNCDGVVDMADLEIVLERWGDGTGILDLLGVLFTWGGDGCSDPNQPPAQGACCIPDVGCGVMSEADCALVGGEYQGDGTGCIACQDQQPAGGIWLDPEYLMSLPTSGQAWADLLAVAKEPAGTPDLSSNDNDADVRTMAKALVAVRNGDAELAAEVRDLCMAAIGTEGGEALALARGLIGYVIAADLVGGMSPEFPSFVRQVRDTPIGGRTLISTHEDRPNNWGTHAAASRLAAALYLGDLEDFDAAATVFRGWLGDRDAYAGFEYGDLCWQANPDEPVGVNPPGASVDGIHADGVVPDDLRRGGCPPTIECQPYAWEALQGVLAAAWILSQHGYPDVWDWSDGAILRAYTWLDGNCDGGVQGDDRWQPWIVNHVYGTSFETPDDSTMHGKNVGWTNWTHPGFGVPFADDCCEDAWACGFDGFDRCYNNSGCPQCAYGANGTLFCEGKKVSCGWTEDQRVSCESGWTFNHSVTCAAD